jgi:hypothetical protein
MSELEWKAEVLMISLKIVKEIGADRVADQIGHKGIFGPDSSPASCGRLLFGQDQTTKLPSEAI